MTRFSKPAALDVVGIGNAIVDILGPCRDSDLVALGITKGAMTLVDEARAATLYAAMTDTREVSGGSAGNTLAGLASLGGKGGYIGRVRDDRFGLVFQKDMQDLGIRFDTPLVEEGCSTARCLIFITPDAERSMNTYLGACVHLSPEDINPDRIADAHVTYMEGYLFDSDKAKRAFVQAAECAHAAGRKVALTLSDSFCVERHRADFLALIADHIDLLFANEGEVLSLYETDCLDHAVNRLRADCALSVVTRGPLGSFIIPPDQDKITIAAEAVAEVKDTTGAGDLYAAGFLFGYTRGEPLPRCGQIAALCAAEVISHIGPRPQTDLAALISQG